MKLIFCFLGLAAIVSAQDIKTIDNAFTAKMFQEVAAANPEKNIVLSAYSVLPPLAQLAMASEGESHNELLKVIGLSDENSIKSIFSKELKEVQNIGKGVQLSLANRLFIAKDAKVAPQFAALSKDVFDSEVKNIDFSNINSAVKEINSWVEDNTNHKIQNLIRKQDVTSTTRMILANAIYFKGNWDKAFQKNQTTLKDFHLAKGGKKQVPMMSSSDEHNYGESQELDAKLLELKYVGGGFSFLVVLPNKVDGLEALQQKLKDPSVLEKAIANMKSEKVDLTLPKFKIETTTNLKQVLQKLNVEKIFGPEAKLTKLLEKESNLQISAAVQKAFIEVDEEGTEAAAANVHITISKSGFPKNTLKLEVDHPFYFQLKNGKIVIFSGRYTQ